MFLWLLPCSTLIWIVDKIWIVTGLVTVVECVVYIFLCALSISQRCVQFSIWGSVRILNILACFTFSFYDFNICDLKWISLIFLLLFSWWINQYQYFMYYFICIQILLVWFQIFMHWIYIWFRISDFYFILCIHAFQKIFLIL